MQRSDSIAKLAQALAKAQGEMENASKNSQNPHFRSKYADLAEIINTVRPVLAKHGLSVTQFPSFDGTLAHVETIIAHESGEWMSGTTSSPVQKADPQGIGSATTYLRRYSLAAVCNLAQEDDDANAASKATKQASQAPKAAPKPSPAPSPTPAPTVKHVPATKATLGTLASYYANESAEVMLDDINEMIVKAKPGARRIGDVGELSEPQAQWLIKTIEAQLQKEAV